ncbi:MAG: hypothetical protein KBD52_00255 [Candidatus Pacebacteria bacterium]|nr:hypothetical protein [Candidatus Paceibacterota bacterium]
MEKPTLFLDLDGTKFQTLFAHVVYINHKYGIQSSPIDYANNPPLQDVIRKYTPKENHHLITEDEVYEDIQVNFLNNKVWVERIPPMEDMPRVVKELLRKYILWTLTARQAGNSDMTWNLINKHILGCISGIHFVHTKNPNGKGFSKFSKVEFVKLFPGEKAGFVDDSANEVIQMEDTIPSYLFDPFGFNDHVSVQNRLRTWKEIGDTFL